MYFLQFFLSFTFLYVTVVLMFTLHNVLCQTLNEPMNRAVNSFYFYLYNSKIDWFYCLTVYLTNQRTYLSSCFSELNFNPSVLSFRIPSVTQNSIFVRWYNNTYHEEEFDKIIFEAEPGMKNFTKFRDVNDASMNITGLLAGTLYNISCYVSKDGVPSNSSVYLSSYTSKCLWLKISWFNSQATEVNSAFFTVSKDIKLVS